MENFRSVNGINYPSRRNLFISDVSDYNHEANVSTQQSRSSLAPASISLSEVKNDVTQRQGRRTATGYLQEGPISSAAVSSNRADYLIQQQQNQQQLNEPRISSINHNVSGRDHLLEKFQELVLSNAETRKRLVEKELELNIAQDSNSRLQAHFNSEVMSLKNLHWKLESELLHLKLEKDTDNSSFFNLSGDIEEIHKKINELCDLELAGDQNAYSFNQDNVSHNSDTCPGPNPCARTRCMISISQIHCKLDRAIQQKLLNLTTGCVDEMDITEDPLGVNELQEQDNQTLQSGTSSFREEMPRNNEFPIQESRITGLSGNNNADGIIPSNLENIQSSVIPILSDTDDDDICIIAEIYNVPKSHSLAAAATNPPLPQTSHNNAFPSSIELDNHLRQNLNCMICKRTFTSTQQLQHHMAEAHQKINLDHRKVYGKMFKSQGEHVHHQKSTQYAYSNYGKHSLNSRPIREATHTTRQQQKSILSTLGARAELSSSSYAPSTFPAAAFSHPTTELIDTVGRYEQIGAATTIMIGPTANPNPSSDAASIISKVSSNQDNNNVSPSALGDSSHARHGLNVSKNLPEEFCWCICGSKYTTRRGLLTHIHSQETQCTFTCSMCNNRFASYAKIRNHMKECHGCSLH